MGARIVKTTLYFQGPSDLSVGTIRIDGVRESIAQWIATPDNRIFRTDAIAPGIYAVQIAPAGVAPQSVIFEVQPGQDNKVILPPFSMLSASGSNTSFFDTSSGTIQPGVPKSVHPELVMLFAGDGCAPTETARETPFDAERATPLKVSRERRRVSIGLSEERGRRESFDTFRGKVRMEVFAGRVELDIPEDPQRIPWGGHRVRMSAAIEEVRIERCLLPLYRGGTRVTVSTPALAPEDLELSIMPIDPHVRALFRVLDAGTGDEVKEVWKSVMNRHLAGPPGMHEADPWVAILTGLLSIRFPDSVPPYAPSMVAALLENVGWAFDTHVIRASQVLSQAQFNDAAAQQEAVAKAISLLAQAQVAGAPYYRYTNQLFGDMVAGIANYFAARKAGVNPAGERRFDRLHRRWYRELPLQRGAGPSFTWLARDAKAVKERHVLVPERHPSGRLGPHGTSVVFEGELSAGKITLLGGGTRGSQPRPGARAGRAIPDRRPHTAPGSWVPGLPATERGVGSPEDPNKGRFGGETSCKGYALGAAFDVTDSAEWAAIVLTVEAHDAAAVGLGDVAWFVLHPTFSPAAVKVPFRGRRAQLRIRAWGGFTVGAWIPKASVQLECDLARSEGAPAIIRTR